MYANYLMYRIFRNLQKRNDMSHLNCHKFNFFFRQDSLSEDAFPVSQNRSTPSKSQEGKKPTDQTPSKPFALLSDDEDDEVPVQKKWKKVQTFFG